MIVIGFVIMFFGLISVMSLTQEGVIVGSVLFFIGIIIVIIGGAWKFVAAE